MKHKCNWPGCQVEVERNLWGCFEHWRKLTPTLRYKILTGQRKSVSKWQDAMKVTAQWIEDNAREK